MVETGLCGHVLEPPVPTVPVEARRDALVRQAEPELAEAVKWGNGCWVGQRGPVAYVYSAPDHVQFGFFRGATLRDPKGLLQGSGKYVRHVKLRGKAEIDEPAFARLLRQAVG